MSSPLDKILNDQTAPLTKGELSKYLSKDLSASEMHQIESKMNADEFNMDAIEGFAEHPSALNDLGMLKNKFNKQVLKNKWYHSTTNIISTTVVAVTMVGAGYFFLSSPESSPKVDEINKTTIAPVSKKSNEIVLEETDSHETPEIEESSVALYEDEKDIKQSNPIPKPEQVTYNIALHDQPQAEKLHIEDVPEEISEEEIDRPVEFIELIETESKNTLIDVKKEELDLQRTNVKLKFIYRLKVVDYSQFYNKPLYQDNIGDSINLSSIPDKSVEYTVIGKEDSKLYVPYEDFLTQGMKMFRKNKFKQALKNFNDILVVYPDDVNAHFYGGICLYNLGKANDAVKHFDMVIKSYILAFNDEAYWYKAICLDKADRDEEAKQVLRQLIEANSFSSEKAKERLKKLENQD